MTTDAQGNIHAGDGKFSTKALTEATGTTLTGRRKVKVGIMSVATLDTYGVEPLPQWPAELGEPSTSYSWDEDGQLEVAINFGSECLTVWGPTGNASDSFTDLGDDFSHIPRAARDQALAYGYRMHENVDSLTSQVLYSAHTPAVRNAIVSVATGNGAPQPCDDPHDPAWRTPAQLATTRTEAGLAAWFGEDVHESTLQDVLTDLMHYADAKGIDSDAFFETLRSARFIQGDEIENPEG
jgi:hypothetical protein